MLVSTSPTDLFTSRGGETPDTLNTRLSGRHVWNGRFGEEKNTVYFISFVYNNVFYEIWHFHDLKILIIWASYLWCRIIWYVFSTCGRTCCLHPQGKVLHHILNMYVPLHDSNLHYQEKINLLSWLITNYLIQIGWDYSQNGDDKAVLKIFEICGIWNVRLFASLNWMKAFNKNRNWCNALMQTLRHLTSVFVSPSLAYSVCRVLKSSEHPITQSQDYNITLHNNIYTHKCNGCIIAANAMKWSP
jgi:hypothetical protein